MSVKDLNYLSITIDLYRRFSSPIFLLELEIFEMFYWKCLYSMQYLTLSFFFQFFFIN